MTLLPAPQPMREMGPIDRARFDAEIRPAGQPIVFRGLAAHWPAVEAGRAGPAALVRYCKQKAHDRPVNAIVGEPAIEGRFFYDAAMTGMNFVRGVSPLAPFLDRLLREVDRPTGYAMAIQSIPAPQLLPGFEEENRIDLLDAAALPRLWLGNAARVAAHYDLMENIGIVVAGRRRFTLFPPDQVSNLYMGPLEITPAGTPISLVDLAAPDLERFPRFAEAARHAQVAELAPGDAIYIPFHWWHAVDSLESVNLFANYWWVSAPEAMLSPHDALLHALFSIRLLPGDQRMAWRAMFDHLVFQLNGDPADRIAPAARGALGAPTADQVAQARDDLLHKLAARR
ncbi:cupin-like domain-containing protein [Sphingomonas sp. HT-1]|uniref:cupin-like domain-containing protein n=1 Tax=unclassified Sphingomonas TaxID=196159 RepID=UPI00031ED4EA|nr:MULTISPECIES: cupin-like domain-containing protein [unclassified Sphingomonas]